MHFFLLYYADEEGVEQQKKIYWPKDTSKKGYGKWNINFE